MNFKAIAHSGKCDVCGKKTDVAVLSSSYGPICYAYCEDCLTKRLEPYSAMVAYISCAGEFPNDINPIYVKDVRRILKEMNISEDKFIDDVKKLISEED